MKKVTTFSSRLHEAILSSGLQQIEVANLSGISKSLLNKYLKGKSEAGNDKLYKLANALNVSPVWLMGYDVEKRNITIPIEKTKKDEVIQDIIEICKYQDEETLRTILTIVKSLDKRK